MALPLAISIALLTAYLVGAIPFGLLIGRLRGVDIRTVGSHNTGATNVMRHVGPRWGVLTLALDVLKGYAAVAATPLAIEHLAQAAVPAWLALACGAAAIVGHNWPVYLRFKGGKGVATSAGVLLGIAPLAFLCGLLAFALVFGLSRYVSLGSIAAAMAVPVAAWLMREPQDMTTPTVLTLLGAIVIWRHRGNIQRLLSGNENRVGKRCG